MRIRYLLYSLCLLALSTESLWAQTLPVGSPVLEDYYRRLQLLGEVDSSISFSVRPLTAEALGQTNLYDPEGVLGDQSYLYGFPGDDTYVQVMPAGLDFNHNGSYPYGWNDGSLVPTRGGQFRFYGGLVAKYRWLSVQFRPEIVYAANQRYGDSGNAPGYGLEWYRATGNVIDQPQYFGKSAYTRILLGQTSVKATFGAVSFGFSTENLYWGPGRYNALLMSNNAQGFPHFTVHTSKPVQTGIGSFEGQLVGGTLTASGFPPSITPDSKHNELYYVEKPDVDRYFSGFVASYQPKWVPGLSLGIIRSFVVNADNMKGVGDYLPFFKPNVKEATYLDANGMEQTSSEVHNRYGSAFFRWVMPAGHLEVYGEYGRSRKAENGRDWMVQPSYSRGYVLGFRKLVPLGFSPGDYLELGAEATELSMNNTYYAKGINRQYPTWYTHPVVRDGYTHRGQVLGAGIGPGSNVQTATIGWVRGFKRIGFALERYVHNEDFFYMYVADIRKSWVDFGWSLQGEWDFDGFLTYLKLQSVHSYNYQHQFSQPLGNSFWNFDPQDKNNFLMRLGFAYRF
ncbi:capsule assembly Wzi family protein [Parapedobacter sp. 10938]|uniref:capsule assembly Wzi family protein n=1 Tax=Parapedobacter flavus TaxID=3110225 RepID=UPI002DBFC321|nr:capsule assembly Wzi family protein [Parapedobacter sp. 10938]MEC3880145.1 capsule assembly Wzi family protein [Parapedobacter sp. 10938]